MNKARRRRSAPTTTAWQPLVPAVVEPRTPQQIRDSIDQAVRIMPELDRATARSQIFAAMRESQEIWRNNLYQVHVIRWDALNINGTECPLVQLSIRRLDRGAARDWRHFQRIKDQLAGPDCEAVELYPAADRLVDTANQFHLWAILNPAFRFPFGYTIRAVDGSSGGGAIQRPLDEELPDAH